MSKPIGNLLSAIIPKKHAWKIKLLGQWEKIIGNMKGKVRIESIKENSITLGIAHSTWAQELFLLTPILKKRINNVLEEEKISKIQFRTVPFNKKKPAPKKTHKSKPIEDQQSLSIIEHSRLLSIENKELTNALEEFCIRCKKTTRRRGKV